MKKLLLLSGIFIILSSYGSKKTTEKICLDKIYIISKIEIKTNEFNNGWEDGYCEGWKDIKGRNAICPITPIAPIPPIGCTNENYKCGYNLGFKAGIKAASKK